MPGRSSTQLIILEESQSDQLPSPPAALPSYIWCWYWLESPSLHYWTSFTPSLSLFTSSPSLPPREPPFSSTSAPSQSAWRKSQHQVTQIRTIHQIRALPCLHLHYLGLHYPCTSLSLSLHVITLPLSLSHPWHCHYHSALAPFSAPLLRQSVCFENRRGWINLAKLLLNQPPLAAERVKEVLVYFLTLGRKVSGFACNLITVLYILRSHLFKFVSP